MEVVSSVVDCGGILRGITALGNTPSGAEIGMKSLGARAQHSINFTL